MKAGGNARARRHLVSACAASLLTFVLSVPWANAADVGDAALRITVEETGGGAAVTSLLAEGAEALAPGGPTELFLLTIACQGTDAPVTVPASSGWGDVSVGTVDGTLTVVLGAPSDPRLPTGLTVRATVWAQGGRSRWNLAVSGLGSGSLTEIIAPRLALAAGTDHTLLLPRYTGILAPDPAGAELDWHEVYPAGWHASMQFFALWGPDRGLYFGLHDPEASLKWFEAVSATDSVVLDVRFPAPDRTVEGNEWTLPGYVALDLFHGDWYDAARIYGRWARESADFWPADDAARRQRLDEIAGIDLWATFNGGYDPDVVRSNTLDFQAYMGLPIGLTWYEWNGLPHDDNYPEYFPELDGMTEATAAMQAQEVTVVPYINGRLFDTSLDGTGPSGLDYATDGRPGAAKQEDGTAFTQSFAGNLFAVMCPTRTEWQDILLSAADRLTRTIGTAGLYIDQVGAASPVECMDPSHGHPLGGGSWWRTGYGTMLDRIHAGVPSGRFLTTEGGADAYLPGFEGFMVQGWQANRMVPAFQAAFPGQVVLFGMKTGVSQYDEPQFYCKLAQAFVHGIQPGRFYTSITGATGDDAPAPVFVRRLGRIRHKISGVLAAGRMMRPERLPDIPEITSTWTYTYDGDIDVTIPAVETSTWAHDDDGERTVIIVLVNASMTDTIAFDLTFDAAAHGIEGTLSVQELGETADGPVTHPDSPFVQPVSLDPLEAVAWQVRGAVRPVRWSATGEPEEVCGDGDTVAEPGEEWAIPVTVENPDVLDHEVVRAVVSPSTGTADAIMVEDLLDFGTVAGGGTATATFRFLVGDAAPCGETVDFDLGTISWSGGAGPGRAAIAPVTLGGAGGVCDSTTPCDAPVAGFDLPWPACAGETLTFTDTSVSAVAWSWDLDGDGTADATVPSPAATYPAAGTVTVTQTVADRNGITDTLTRQLDVTGIVSAVPADVDGDDTLGASDLAAWVAELTDGDGTDASVRCLGFPTTSQADLDGDGDIDRDDFLSGLGILFP